MSEQIFEFEAESLEEAREQMKSQLPEGFRVISEEVLSDGKPITKNKQKIETEAGTIEEAKEQIKAKIPPGLQLLAEQILSDGMPKTVKAVAETTDTAFAKAQSEIPDNAELIEKKELSIPEQKIITVEAFNEMRAMSSAKSQLHKHFSNQWC